MPSVLLCALVGAFVAPPVPTWHGSGGGGSGRGSGSTGTSSTSTSASRRNNCQRGVDGSLGRSGSSSLGFSRSSTHGSDGGWTVSRKLSVPRRSSDVQCIGPQLPGLSTSEPPVSGPRVDVEIETTGINSRCISASIIVNASPNQIWKILTDYDNLATHVPNLVQSNLRPHPTGGIRLYQEGAQKIVGFDFRAALTMDMVEVVEAGASSPTRITFSLIDSAMFATFDGEWRVQPFSRVRSAEDPTQFDFKSKLSYRVNITPKGPVPVPALEWRIREDVPVNLKAVSIAAEKLKAQEREQERERARERERERLQQT